MTPVRRRPTAGESSATGLRPPTHFGDAEVRACFPAPEWDIVVSGDAIMHGVPLHAGRTIEDIPSWFAVVRPRA